MARENNSRIDLDGAKNALDRAKMCLDLGANDISFVQTSLEWLDVAITAAFTSVPTLHYATLSGFINSSVRITEIYGKQSRGEYLNAAKDHPFDRSLAQQYLSDAETLIAAMQDYRW